mmetsp:Transcript_7475/g.33732  ORF Transcript_7475/g.33732 Transcript_7475/m.33732 type:complete len:264 (+) Transcript_7475:3762-4553(+)
MTSGFTNSRILSDVSIKSRVFTSPGHSAEAADHSVLASCVCDESYAAPLTRRPDAASATTAHPSVRASSAAASASAASPPPATTSNPRLADLTNDASSRRSRLGLGFRVMLDPPRAATPWVNGASLRSHPWRPRRSRPGFHSDSIGPSGSRNWQLTCTGPGLGPCRCRNAVAIAVAAHRAGDPSPGGAKSTLHAVYDPKILTWSIVWFAPLSRNSGGRSAVSNRSGAFDSHASTAAGSKFATAVPDDVITAAARPLPRPYPSA